MNRNVLSIFSSRDIRGVFQSENEARAGEERRRHEKNDRAKGNCTGRR